MNQTALTFGTDGNCRCFYTESIDLNTIGVLEVERVTTIEFDQTNQVWEIRTTAGALLFSDVSRAKCLAWEHVEFSNWR